MLTLTLLQYLDANFNYRALSTLIFIILCNDVMPNNKNQIFLQNVQPLDNYNMKSIMLYARRIRMRGRAGILPRPFGEQWQIKEREVWQSVLT